MKLKIGTDAAATFASLEISEAVLEADYQGRSKLTLTMAGELDAAAIIAPFERCELQTDDGTVRWIGWLDAAPRKGSSGRITYVLQGPHRFLERANFAQGVAGLAILAGWAGSSGLAPQVFAVSLIEILDRALTKYPGEFTYDGQYTFIHETPTRWRADVDCLTALQSILAFCPEAVLWWTFPEESPPVLNIGTSVGTATHTLNAATMEVSEADINPRYDMLYDELFVYYIANGSVLASYSASGSGDAYTLGANRTKQFTYDISVLNNYPASGLETFLYAYWSKLWIDAKATVEAIDWTHRPGSIWGFGGTKLSLYSSHTTVLHTLTRDLMAERTTLDLGVMPGKVLYKVNDLDIGVTQAATNPAYTPFSPTEVSALKDVAAATPLPEVPEGETGSWIEVERCDGQTMKVLGTGWSS